MNRSTFNLYLKIIYNLAVASTNYTLVLNYVQQIKKSNGSCFVLDNEDWQKQKIILETILTLPDPKESSKVYEVNFMKELQNLTLDFLLMSAISVEELTELALHFVTSSLIIDSSIPDIPKGYYNECVATLRSRPWAIMLLLLELLPVNITDIID